MMTCSPGEEGDHSYPLLLHSIITFHSSMVFFPFPHTLSLNCLNALSPFKKGWGEPLLPFSFLPLPSQPIGLPSDALTPHHHRHYPLCDNHTLINAGILSCRHILVWPKWKSSNCCDESCKSANGYNLLVLIFTCWGPPIRLTIVMSVSHFVVVDDFPNHSHHYCHLTPSPITIIIPLT